MAALPKVDSSGLRLAKSAGAERVSSVVRVSKSELRREDEGKRGGGSGHEERHADRAVQAEGRRK
jgi:hypothetical protein